MKLLILSPCGKTKEPEDTAYIDLYLASLKKYIVPHFDVKVILFNNALTEKSNESITYQRVKEFELENVVEVKNMYELGLPQESINFLDSLHWTGKIGIVMNMLFDYSKMNNFFDADWVFHFDTDLEFLDNFATTLQSIDKIKEINPEIILTVAGDTYPYNMRYKNVEFIFDEPTRIDIYNPQTISHYYNVRNLKVNHNKYSGSEYETSEKLTFILQQQKIRNDFVGYSSAAAKVHTFNWISCHYPNNFVARKGIPHLENNEDAKLLETLWKEKSSEYFDFLINHDKGSLPQLFLQGSNHNAFKIQLRGYCDMARHFSSGYFSTNTDWVAYSHTKLQKEHQDTKHIWEKDFT